MVAPVEQDARGIVDPGAGLQRFRLHRHEPSPAAARFVDRYWVVSWDLPAGESFTQRVLPHPVVNLSLQRGEALVNGATRRMDARTIEGRGQVLGVMFRPAGFHPLLRRSASSLTDCICPARSVLGPTILDDLARELDAGRVDPLDAVRTVDELLADRLPAGPVAVASEATTSIVELVAGDPGTVRVDDLAARCELSVRQLQRRFAEHVGLSPKAVIRRYRLHEAAERARREIDVDWGALAAELHYSDQSHLVRDFSATFGMSPDRYARSQVPVTPSSS